MIGTRLSTSMMRQAYKIDRADQKVDLIVGNERLMNTNRDGKRQTEVLVGA